MFLADSGCLCVKQVGLVAVKAEAEEMEGAAEGMQGGAAGPSHAAHLQQPSQQQMVASGTGTQVAAQALHALKRRRLAAQPPAGHEAHSESNLDQGERSVSQSNSVTGVGAEEVAAGAQRQQGPRVVGYVPVYDILDTTTGNRLSEEILDWFMPHHPSFALRRHINAPQWNPLPEIVVQVGGAVGGGG